MGDGSDTGARLAELLAALSLGIDLGFGQPMEHVLRQCRIALRLCELAGGGDDARAAVYYSAPTLPGRRRSLCGRHRATDSRHW